LIGDETAFTTAKRFDSRENADASALPALVVQFAPPAVPALPTHLSALLCLLLATTGLRVSSSRIRSVRELR
jgi:hypothetical protein